MSYTGKIGICKRCHKEYSELYRILEGNLYCRYCFGVMLEKIDRLIKEEVM